MEPKTTTIMGVPAFNLDAMGSLAETFQFATAHIPKFSGLGRDLTDEEKDIALHFIHLGAAVVLSQITYSGPLPSPEERIRYMRAAMVQNAEKN